MVIYRFTPAEGMWPWLHALPVELKESQCAYGKPFTEKMSLILCIMCNRMQREVGQRERVLSRLPNNDERIQSFSSTLRDDRATTYVFEVEIRLWHWEVMTVSFSQSKYRSGHEKAKLNDRTSLGP